MLVQLVPSYVNRSQQVVNKPVALGTLSPTTSLSTSDATTMYTYIDIKKCFKKLGKEYKRYILFKLLIKLLRLIMISNVFNFENTWWLQQAGTAMCTPCTCAYATLFFSVF